MTAARHQGPDPELDDRVFNRRGRRHFRRTYSEDEVKVGAAIGLLLAGIAAWVYWKGDHPDPTLAQTAADLMKPAGQTAPVARPSPLPATIAPAGFRETKRASYDPSNVYEKINGREAYYKGFGFVRLDFASLERVGRPEVFVDVELFGLGQVENAIGAMAGEVPEGGSARLHDGSLVFEGQSSTLAARGEHYLRLIGSESSPEVLAAIVELRDRLLAVLPAKPMPLGFTVFSGLLGLPPGRVAYEAADAFSLSFARDVHLGRQADESELFLVVTPDEAAARQLAARFVGGFREYGEDGGALGGLTWVKDRYLATFASATHRGRVVAGVRGAVDREKGVAAIGRLVEALAALERSGGLP